MPPHAKISAGAPFKLKRQYFLPVRLRLGVPYFYSSLLFHSLGSACVVLTHGSWARVDVESVEALLRTRPSAFYYLQLLPEIATTGNTACPRCFRRGIVGNSSALRIPARRLRRHARTRASAHWRTTYWKPFGGSEGAEAARVSRFKTGEGHNHRAATTTALFLAREVLRLQRVQSAENKGKPELHAHKPVPS